MYFIFRGDVVFIKSKCYASKRKNEKPYTVDVAIELVKVQIIDSTCSCPAGHGVCNHTVTLLRLLSYLKRDDQESCTDKPQKWNRVKGQKLGPLNILDLNFQSPKEHGSSTPIHAKVYQAGKHPRSPQKLNEARNKLILLLEATGDTDFANSLPPPNSRPWIKTKFGEAPSGSAASYQLALIDKNFELLTNIKNVSESDLVPSLSCGRPAIPCHRLENVQQALEINPIFVPLLKSKQCVVSIL